MKKFVLGIGLILTTAGYAQNNVGIGTLAPDASAKLEINSNSSGVLIPRMNASSITAISNPATGLLVYQTDGTAGFYYNAGTPGAPVWKMVGDDAPYTNMQSYYTPTTTNFNVPAGVYRIYFEIVGGGGGQGGTYLNGLSSHGGGGGGGGGFATGYINVTPGEALTLVIGDRGSNGTNGTPGTDGTDGGLSSISSGATTLITVTGGAKGLAATSTTNGSGGGGGTATVVNARTKLLSTQWASPSGMPGFNGSSANVLTGDGGVVSNMGKFNKNALVFTSVTGGYSVNVPKPLYGLGWGDGAVGWWGYIVLYW